MRRIAYTVAIALTIAGCSLAPAKFDPFLQWSWAALWQKAKRLEQACAMAERIPPLEQAIVHSMYESAELLGAYVEYQDDAGAKEIMRAYMELQDKVGAVHEASSAYCQASAVNLQDAANRALQTFGRRER